jgi:TonB family protein
MFNLCHSGGGRWKGLLLALVCLVELPQSRAQNLEKPHALTVLSAQQVSSLILTQTHPQYPMVAKLNFIQGVVRLQIRVSTDGKVSTAHVIDGNPLLAAAVLDVVPEWRYRPFVAGGVSSSFITLVDINFALRMLKSGRIPAQAEMEFNRQVIPPKVLTRPEDPASALRSTHLRVLVDADGKVIDAKLLQGSPSQFEAAKKSVAQWSFRPARWGTIPVAWYLDVTVPTNAAPA